MTVENSAFYHVAKRNSLPRYEGRHPSPFELELIQKKLRAGEFNDLNSVLRRWVFQYLIPRLNLYGHVKVSGKHFSASDIV